MSYHISFGDFRVRADQLKSVEETIDIEGNPCVMLRYAEEACIILYDEAAEEAVDWFQTHAADAIHRSVKMPRKEIYANRGRIEFGEGIDTSPPQEAATSKLPTKAEREQGVREMTLEAIGTPDDLTLVDVKQLHDVNHYRVNIYRTVKCIIKMYESFYVVMTPDGIISLPIMTKKYYDGDLAAISASKSR